MRRDMKNALKDAFSAPNPILKDAFLRNYPHTKISNVEFMLSQAGYIPIWVWGVSFMTFAIALFSTHFMKEYTLFILSLCIPFVALAAVAENGKSAVYKMAELEMASLFSLKSVILARMGIIGFTHAILFCLLIPLVSMEHTAAIRVGVYLIVPYLLTTSLCLAFTRKFHNRDSIYLYLGIAGMVSALFMITQLLFSVCYRKENFHYWVGGLIILAVIMISEYYQTIQRTEELTWSL